jgi:predicted transcriptional regulator
MADEADAYNEWLIAKLQRAMANRGGPLTDGDVVFEEMERLIDSDESEEMGNIWTEPAVSGHDTKEEAEAYDKWFREEVEAGLAEADAGNLIPHDQVVAEMRALQEKKRRERDVR